ncbi:MAG: tetratricopeptide repeat protein [Phycisphaerales bacterium]
MKKEQAHMSRRSRTILAAALILAPIALLGGCGNQRAPVNEIISIDQRAQIEEARNRIAMAEDAMKAGDVDRAIDLYRQSIDSYPQLAVAWNDLGVALMSKRRNQEASQCFHMAANVDPTDPRPFYNLGSLFQSLYYDDDAHDYFVKALERKSNYLPALRGAIQTSDLGDRRSEKTLDWIRKALMLETDPDWINYLRKLRLEVESEVALEDR